jgi:hypothetical protein
MKANFRWAFAELFACSKPTYACPAYHASIEHCFLCPRLDSIVVQHLRNESKRKFYHSIDWTIIGYILHILVSQNEVISLIVYLRIEGTAQLYSSAVCGWEVLASTGN